jgi:hypothetical protein
MTGGGNFVKRPRAPPARALPKDDQVAPAAAAPFLNTNMR